MNWLIASSLVILAAAVAPAIAGEHTGKQNYGLITGSTGKAPPEEYGANYCKNIADEASEAQVAWRMAKIAELEAELEKRMEQLDAKKAALQKWMAQRNRFLELARGSLVDIYSRMRPDAAAQQIAALDDLTAAAIVMKLDARVASLIMAEIEAERAARLTRVIVGAARSKPAGEGT